MEHIETTQTENNKLLTHDECVELKNIKYKTMLLSGTPLKETKNTNNLLNLDKFLEDEKNFNKGEPWCKLDKTEKIKKIMEFTEKYKKDNNLDDEEAKLLVFFLKDSIDRKKLQRVKDVVYDKTSGLIKDIPSLVYTKTNKHFTLKNVDKRVSTIKSLTPKKNTNIVRGTIKKKEMVNSKNNDTSSDESDE